MKTNQQLNFNLPTTTTTTSFRSQIDVLEPSFLGIRPEPPFWPARDELIRDNIARRASSIDLPLSLRMIKMKQRLQRLEEEREIRDLGENVDVNNPVSNLCWSTLYIIKEVQSRALKIKGLVLDEDVDGIVSKAQREMTSSFVWLFKEVFAKTPDLMLEVSVLTSSFAAHSLEVYSLPEEAPMNVEVEEKEKLGTNSTNWGAGGLELGILGVPTREILEEKEVGLWNSMVEEAKEMKLGHGEDEGLGFVVDGDDHDHDRTLKKFVSPVKVEIERDDYEEYYRTDLLYQIGLSQEPNNTLLLSNYAQFLCLVSRDYDRAEECFKRSIQLDPSDAEVVSQYANFLWLFRKDMWGAEERFQQAVAAEPDNSYHASKYANFLWSTGGDDTCYPLDPPLGKS